MSREEFYAAVLNDDTIPLSNVKDALKESVTMPTYAKLLESDKQVKNRLRKPSTATVLASIQASSSVENFIPMSRQGGPRHSPVGVPEVDVLDGGGEGKGRGRSEAPPRKRRDRNQHRMATIETSKLGESRTSSKGLFRHLDPQRQEELAELRRKAQYFGEEVRRHRTSCAASLLLTPPLLSLAAVEW